MKGVFALLLAAASAAWATFWMEDIAHRGIAPFNPDRSYTVFRNVRDFGAKGDGSTDDTTAINAAISSGERCGGYACAGSTTTPAVVYFPPGTYLITAPIVNFYYTQIIGDPNDMPTIMGSPSFPVNAIALLDGDRYLSNGKLNFQATNVFFRQIRNLIFDTRNIRGNATAIHWPSSQATLIQNCAFRLSSREGDIHTGIFMEEGSGGMITDLVFHGGKYGARFGNQQYTMRNLTFYGSDTGIEQIWNWGWTYKSLRFFGCNVGINMSSWDVGSVTLLDSSFVNVTTALVTGRNPGIDTGIGSLVVQNVEYRNVPTVLKGRDGQPLLLGDPNGTVRDGGYARGNVYAPKGPRLLEGRNFIFSQPSTLKLGNRYYERSKPQYEHYPVTVFVSAREHQAVGDGVADDTGALNTLFRAASNTSQIVFLDAGYYKVTDTLYIPPDTRIVGEGLAAVIMGAGKNFADESHPRPVVQVGRPGDVGRVEMSDIIVSTQGATAGAIMIQYNLNTAAAENMCAPGRPPSGLWDVHTRVGGFAGSQLQAAECPITPDQANVINSACISGYMSMHITSSARNLYVENSWLWVADHDIEHVNSTRINVFVARGLLVEGTQIWLVGSSVEHHTMYQYQLVNASDIWMGQIQTETPYYQPNPPAPYPFTRNPDLWDPDFDYDCHRHADSNSVGLRETFPCEMAWGLRVVSSRNVVVFGAGLYSFFNNYNTSCSTAMAGESCQARIFWVGGETGDNNTGLFAVEMYNLNTIGSNLATFASTLAAFRC
ncbi:glycoside hydrolase family 55 protein [Trichocladium antarcticum]|uniref:Glycoside hydrolase family 55 protein n=1 Tax=Trichocladium antarcticum TaxID=1450529 RepID=A0AAN6ZD76_9PEZI|nr:glycoside hydrolase family 55 protein [Trichocladium antarcticum]